MLSQPGLNAISRRSANTHGNPSTNGGKEVKSVGGLSSSNSWHHPLQSPDNRTSQDLAQYINSFFTGHSVSL